MISWRNDSHDNVAALDDLISLDGEEKKEGWSKSELVETDDRKQLRRDKQNSLLGSVVLLMIV